MEFSQESPFQAVIKLGVERGEAESVTKAKFTVDVDLTAGLVELNPRFLAVGYAYCGMGHYAVLVRANDNLALSRTPPPSSADAASTSSGEKESGALKSAPTAQPASQSLPPFAAAPDDGVAVNAEAEAKTHLGPGTGTVTGAGTGIPPSSAGEFLSVAPDGRRYFIVHMGGANGWERTDRDDAYRLLGLPATGLISLPDLREKTRDLVCAEDFLSLFPDSW